MSAEQLRPGWRTVRFGDVVRQVKDKVDPEAAGIERYVAGEHMDTDDLRIRRWGMVGDGYLGPAFTMRFRPGQVLYGSRRTYLRKVALADFEGICANTTFVVESASEELLPEFLPYVMTAEAFHEHSIKQSKGSVNPYINFSDLKWYEFALPPPDEQKEIVGVLAESLSLLEHLIDAHRDSHTLYQSELAAEFGRPTTRSLLSDWVAEGGVIAGPFGSQLHASDYVSDGVPLLNPLDMDVDRVKRIPETRVPVEFGKRYPQYVLQEGDLVLARRGDLDKRVRIGAEQAGWILGSDCVRVRLREPELSTLVLHSLCDRGTFRWILQHSTRTTMPGTSTKTVSALPLRIPEASRRADFLQRVGAARELIDEVARHIVSTRTLADAVREQMLEGAVGVR